ncbi:MAG: PadR family transcriptional regulator [Sphingobacteriia bacterium]|nr:MAG: PadR family transcriptional regulator [Sphingobacteriia bacterium]
MNKSSLYKGCLESIVLRLLKEQGRMYGYQITQEVKHLTAGELKITEGALYPLLHKLEEQGLLQTSTEKVENRIRKYYALTPAGKKESSKALVELKQFVQQLENIFKLQTAWK